MGPQVQELVTYLIRNPTATPNSNSNSNLKPGPTSIKTGLNPHLTSSTLNPNPCFSSSLSKNPSRLLKPHSPMILSLSRRRHRALTNPSLIHLFCSSTDSSSVGPSDDQNPSEPPQEQHQSLFSNYFSDVKASLKQQSPQNQYQPPLRRPTYPTDRSASKDTDKISSLDEIRKNLSEYKRRASGPPPSPNSAPSSQSSPNQQISFRDLYKKSALADSEGADGTTSSSRPKSGSNTYQTNSAMHSFNSIRESLRQMRANNNVNAERSGGAGEAMSFSGLKLKPKNENDSMSSSTVIGGTEGLPTAVFGKERKEVMDAKQEMSTEFVKMYSFGELGEKLRSLRPEVEKGQKEWFTLEELNERLRKLRFIEEKEAESKVGVSYRDLRESLVKLKSPEEEKSKKASVQRGIILGAPNLMLQPPKESLVEKYYHPDNMSSSEKLKIELAKVRDEFKMSDSDCGSARVQVAQLTMKIKHLSSLLHKKDKHSRKGLIAMVQKRKKLLKYLRRTDWDSYCFVLSKLGLRDNPDHKFLIRH